MKIVLKKNYIVCITLLLMSNLYAQKTAFIDYNKLYENVPIYTKKLDAFNNIKLTLETEIANRKKDNNSKYHSLLRKYDYRTSESIEFLIPKMTDEDLVLLNALETEEKEIKNLANKYNEKLSQLDHIELKPIQNWLNLEIANYCQKENIELLYSINESNALIYYDEKLNITNDFLEKIKDRIKIIGKEDTPKN